MQRFSVCGMTATGDPRNMKRWSIQSSSWPKYHSCRLNILIKWKCISPENVLLPNQCITNSTNGLEIYTLIVRSTVTKMSLKNKILSTQHFIPNCDCMSQKLKFPNWPIISDDQWESRNKAGLWDRYITVYWLSGPRLKGGSKGSRANEINQPMRFSKWANAR